MKSYEIFLIFVISILSITIISAEEFGYNLLTEPTFDNVTASVNNSEFCDGILCSLLLRTDGGNSPIADIDWGNHDLENIDDLTVNDLLSAGSWGANLVDNDGLISLKSGDYNFLPITANWSFENETLFTEEATFNDGTTTFGDTVFKSGINEALIRADSLGRIRIDAATDGAFPYLSFTPHASTVFGMLLWHPASGAYTNFKTVDSSPDYLSIAVGTSNTFGGITLTSIGHLGVLKVAASTHEIDVNGAIRLDEVLDIDADTCLRIGASQDSEICYDGQDVVINPKVMGSGLVSILGSLNVSENLNVTGNINLNGSSSFNFYNDTNDLIFKLETGGTGNNQFRLLNETNDRIIDIATNINFFRKLIMNTNQITQVKDLHFRETSAGARANVEWQNESGTPFVRLSSHTSDDPSGTGSHFIIYTTNSTDDMKSRFDIDAQTDEPQSQFNNVNVNFLISDSSSRIAVKINSTSTSPPFLIVANITSKTCTSGQAGGIYYDGGTNKHRGCDGTNWNDLY